MLDARPDSLDFRDRMFVSTLTEVPTRIDLGEYRKAEVPVLNQGTEGACTGFGLATVANYLLRTRAVVPDKGPVSASMLYEMAKRYDEWPGEEYPGSSARGAMKGWHKHGVCSQQLWKRRRGKVDGRLTRERVTDAAKRPLGAYFRVNHRDLVAIHCALAEVKVLYATAIVHSGWNRPGGDGQIAFQHDKLGGHAFAIVAYDENGLWIQNSWGTSWGLQGFGLITYDDWLANGTDVWVARLGVPVLLRTARATARVRAEAGTETAAYTFEELRPHIVSLGNNGLLRESGTFGTSTAELRTIIQRDFPRITKSWKKKRLLLYAHGGLTDEKSAIQRLADYRQALLENEVYPIALIWKTDIWTTVTNILRDALSRRRAEGLLIPKDFMLDRLDDALEPLARVLGGKHLWDEMKENARLATVARRGGIRKLATQLAKLIADDQSVELHLAGHSAAGVLHAPLTQLLTAEGRIKAGPMKGKSGLNLEIATCTLWAPACTVELFNETYLGAALAGRIGSLSLFTLTDEAEQDDHCGNIYHKSLLYLVSNAFEEVARVPLIRPRGEPIAGMQRFVEQDRELQKAVGARKLRWILAPNAGPAGSPDASSARRHGDFDDDENTLRATLARIIGTEASKGQFEFHASAASMSDKRHNLSRRGLDELVS